MALLDSQCNPNPADAIVLLGNPINDDGSLSSEGRLKLEKAEEFLHLKLADKLVICGGAVKNKFVEAEVLAQNLDPNLIGKENIYLETNSQNTVENADLAYPILKELGVKKIIIVTIPFHTKRAKEIFDRLPIENEMVAAYRLTENPIFNNFKSLVRETLAYAYYLIFGYPAFEGEEVEEED